MLAQQANMEEKMKQQYDKLKLDGEKMMKKIKKQDKNIREEAPQIESAIIDFIKKYTIH